MKLERKLWILSLFLALVIVIPSVALTQVPPPYTDLHGTWRWQANERCNDFDYGTTSSEPEKIELCVVQNANDLWIYTYDEDITDWVLVWSGYTSYNFIGADLVEDCCTSVLTGNVSINGQSIRGTLVYFERQGYSLEDVCTAGYRFTMNKISEVTPCAP